MTAIEVFSWGFGGSVAVEIVNAVKHYDLNGELPSRYKDFLFWGLRVLLAIVGGGLAIAYEIDKMLLAANIGAATPLIIQQLASKGISSASSDVAATASMPQKRGRTPTN